MTTEINDAIGRYALKVRNEALDKVLDELWKRYMTFQQVLENGQEILCQAQGERFNKLYEKRKLLWQKLTELGKVISIISDIRY